VAAPGSYTEVVTAPPTSGARPDTGQACIAMLTEKGPAVATLIRSEDEAATIFGADTTTTHAGTYLQGFFRTGGTRAWVRRLTGTTPVKAFITLNGSGATASVKFTANDYGAYSHDYRMAVIAGLVSGIRVQLSSASGAFTTLTSPDLADKAAVLAYTGFSSYGAWTSAGAGTVPVTVAAAALATGTDDSGTLDDTIRAAALLELTGKGPSQFLLPGDSRAAAAILLEAAVVANPARGIGLFDGTDDPSAGTVGALAASAGDLPHVQMLAPWATVPPLVAGGVVRDLPYSIVQAGIIARQDRITGNPNRPAAGDRGIAPWITGVKASWTAAERDTLNTAGVTVARDVYGNGTIRTYGFRTLANPSTQVDYLQAANVRCHGAVLGEGKAICDRYVFEQFDGKGKTAGKLAGELGDMLGTWRDIGALFPLLDEDTGQEIDPGYLVSLPTLTGTAVVAPISARFSPGAEMVTLRLIITSIDEAF
jgi:hypothetical protein